MGAARLAYRDVLFHGRFCAYVLYLHAWIRARSMSTRIRKNWRCGFAIRAASTTSCFETLEKVLADTRPSAESAGSAPADWLTGASSFAAAAVPRRRILPAGSAAARLGRCLP